MNTAVMNTKVMLAIIPLLSPLGLMGGRGILLEHIKSLTNHIVDPVPGEGSNRFLASISTMCLTCDKIVVSDGVEATGMFHRPHYRSDVTS